MGRRRLIRVPRAGARLLVAIALLRPPPGDPRGGYGQGNSARYVYRCKECDRELEPLSEPAQPGEEPYCTQDRAHGRTMFLRQI
jgi:hypothetical protein